MIDDSENAPDAGNPERPDVEAAVREAIEALQRRPDRDADTGKFVKGTQAAGNTLERSAAFWESVSAVKAELVASVKGGRGERLDDGGNPARVV